MKEEPTYADLQSEVASLTSQVARLRMRVAYLERMLYGSKSDRLASKVPDDQPGLFDELLKEAIDERDRQIEQAAEDIRRETEQRRAKARKEPARPAKYHYYGLEERTAVVMPDGVDASECDVIGTDVTRVLHREPAKVWVEVIERPLLRRRADKGADSVKVYQAPAPAPVIAGGHVAADMLSQIIIDKYRYHQPEYRQIKQYADLGLRLPASTLNGWVHAAAARLEPVYEALRRDILRGDYLQIDEVPWRIADGPGKCRHGYAWQFLDARPDSHGTYFLYIGGSRGGAVPRGELLGFRGAIQADGYAVYDFYENLDDVTLLGCMAHVRRKFTDAQTSCPDLAARAVRWIGLLYEIEDDLRSRGAGPEETARCRQAKAIPIMDAMERWIEDVHTLVTPSDPMGKALEYAYKMWPRLRRYALDGRYHIDNNAVERNQRPSVMGRKNYLFSKTDDGAVDNAIFYSLIEICDMVGVDPLRWLRLTLDGVGPDPSPERAAMFLPHNCKKSCG